MDPLSRLNTLLQRLQHRPATYHATSTTIWNVKVTLDPATVALLTSSPYLAARMQASLRKGARGSDLRGAKGKAVREVVEALELLSEKTTKSGGGGNAKKEKAKNAKGRSAPKGKEARVSRTAEISEESLDDLFEDANDGDGEMILFDDDGEEEEGGEEDAGHACEDEDFGHGIQAALAPFSLHQHKSNKKIRRHLQAPLSSSVNIRPTSNPRDTPASSKKRSRQYLSETDCEEERRRKNLRRE